MLVSLVVGSCDPAFDLEEVPGPPSHDFALSVRIAGEEIQDNRGSDLDPTTNRIVVRGYRPAGFEGQVMVDYLQVVVRSGGEDQVEVASTSTPDTPGKSAQFLVGSEGPTPFAELPVTFSIELGDFFAGEPTGYRTTVHLTGEYLSLNEEGRPQVQGIVSHGRIELTGEAVEAQADGADPAILDLGTVEGETLQDEAGPELFAPSDIQREFESGSLRTLRGRLRMELGPSTGISLPVSAAVGLEALRE